MYDSISIKEHVSLKNSYHLLTKFWSLLKYCCKGMTSIVPTHLPNQIRLVSQTYVLDWNGSVRLIGFDENMEIFVTYISNAMIMKCQKAPNREVTWKILYLYLFVDICIEKEEDGYNCISMSVYIYASL